MFLLFLQFIRNLYCECPKFSIFTSTHKKSIKSPCVHKHTNWAEIIFHLAYKIRPKYSSAAPYLPIKCEQNFQWLILAVHSYFFFHHSLSYTRPDFILPWIEPKKVSWQWHTKVYIWFMIYFRRYIFEVF